MDKPYRKRGTSLLHTFTTQWSVKWKIRQNSVKLYYLLFFQFWIEFVWNVICFRCCQSENERRSEGDRISESRKKSECLTRQCHIITHNNSAWAVRKYQWVCERAHLYTHKPYCIMSSTLFSHISDWVSDVVMCLKIMSLSGRCVHCKHWSLSLLL